MRNSEIASKLKKHFVKQTTITTQEISEVLIAAFPDLSPNTISWRINQLKKDQFIQQVGRGLYSFEFKPEYQPEISLKTKRVYNRIKPLCQSALSVWDTQMLDAIIGIRSDKHWMFFATAKEDLESLFDQMLDFSKQVFLQPDKEVINRYMMPLNEAIILTPLISETPLEKSGDYFTPTIEGILVNAWLAFDNYLAPSGYDIKELYQSAFSKYNINQSKLLRFSTRRDKRTEIEKFIKNITQ